MKLTDEVAAELERCPAKRCGATVVQFRRGKPLEMRCRAAVGKIPGLCDGCVKRMDAIRQFGERFEREGRAQ